ncbi:hypothetical protein BaRGS_00001602 [Batillaria attramentaria]|uniref:Uncharacterized protein n=1 Tax=Batillaria attramentaria TaxID=370345 RepID=A0ABD0M813_9CAEN
METDWRPVFPAGYGKAPRLQAVSMYLAAVALLSFTRLCQGEDAYIWADNRKETSDITCWTCSDKKDNDACNDWAPDLHCPLNHTVCLTRHRFNPSSGLSVLVTKQCVQPLDCTATHVGCSLTDTGHKVSMPTCPSVFDPPSNPRFTFLHLCLSCPSGHLRFASEECAKKMLARDVRGFVEGFFVSLNLCFGAQAFSLLFIALRWVFKALFSL